MTPSKYGYFGATSSPLPSRVRHIYFPSYGHCHWGQPCQSAMEAQTDYVSCLRIILFLDKIYPAECIARARCVDPPLALPHVSPSVCQQQMACGVDVPPKPLGRRLTQIPALRSQFCRKMRREAGAAGKSTSTTERGATKWLGRERRARETISFLAGGLIVLACRVFGVRDMLKVGNGNGARD